VGVGGRESPVAGRRPRAAERRDRRVAGQWGRVAGQWGRVAGQWGRVAGRWSRSAGPRYRTAGPRYRKAGCRYSLGVRGAGCWFRIADRCFPDGARRFSVDGRCCRRARPGRDDHGSRSRLLVRQPRRRPGPLPGSRVRRRRRRGTLVDYGAEGWRGYGRQHPWPAVRRRGARNGPAAPGCPSRGASCRNPPPARTPPATPNAEPRSLGPEMTKRRLRGGASLRVSAATYSPTQLPGQYHRRWRA
jgi:hypothetical protein